MVIDTRPLLRPREVAEWLGVPTETLRNWRYLGRGPRWTRVGRHIRYRPVDVERYLDQQSRGPEEAA